MSSTFSLRDQGNGTSTIQTFARFCSTGKVRLGGCALAHIRKKLSFIICVFFTPCWPEWVSWLYSTRRDPGTELFPVPRREKMKYFAILGSKCMKEHGWTWEALKRFITLKNFIESKLYGYVSMVDNMPRIWKKHFRF